jgi:hypothetical protein
MPPVDTADVNAFYADAMLAIGVDFDIWTSAANGYTFPTIQTMAQYTSILLLEEQEIANASFGLGVRPRITASKVNLLRQYLDIGGKLIFSGAPNILLTFGTLSNSPWWFFDDPSATIPPVSLANEIFHVQTLYSPPELEFVQNDAFDLVGATGILGYPDVEVDTTKLPAEAMGAIRNISLNYPRGFGQTIYHFDSRVDSVEFEGSPIGVRYLAPPAIAPARQTYSVIYYGFPLYYMMKDDVIEVLRKSFEDINE